METLKEVIKRTDNLSDEEATLKIESIKTRLSSSANPSDVLIDEFGSDVERLKEILTPEKEHDNT